MSKTGTNRQLEVFITGKNSQKLKMGSLKDFFMKDFIHNEEKDKLGTWAKHFANEALWKR